MATTMERPSTREPGGATATAIFPNSSNHQTGGKQPLLANDETNRDIEQGDMSNIENEKATNPAVGTKSPPVAGSTAAAENKDTRSIFRLLNFVSLAGENKLAFPDTTGFNIEFARACFAEFWATALFVFIGTGSVAATGEFLVLEQPSTISASVSRIIPIATAFGIAITVLIFSIGHVSGGHINPAVTLGLFLMGKLSAARALCYMFCQFAGAVLGSAFLLGCLSGLPSSVPIVITSPNGKNQTTIDHRVGYPAFFLGANQLNTQISSGNGLLFETLGTSILLFTVFMSAVDQRSFAASNLVPVPIGFSIWIVHLVLIPFTGCGINPARTFGPALVNSMAGVNVWGGYWWIYYVGPIIGTLLSVIVVRILWGGAPPALPGVTKNLPKEEKNKE
jgi:aquaporin PIP